LEFPGGGRGVWAGCVRPKHLKKCMKLYWNFHRGEKGGGEKISCVGEVWIFSGTTQCVPACATFKLPKLKLGAL